MITDSLSNTTYYGYDALNRLGSIENALEQVDQYTYDEVSNLISSSDPDNNTIYFQHDELNRQTEIDYPDGDFSYYQYNQVSDLTLFEDPHGITYLEYNDLSRLNSEKQPGGATTTYNYNGLGQTILFNNSVGQIKYTYDDAQRMTQVDNVTDFYGYGSQSWANTPYGGEVDSTTDSCYYEYNANNLVTKKTLGNGVFTYFSYDEANRITEILNCSPDGSPLVYFSYDYDQNSRITAIERENGTVIYYGYDDASRLTSESWYDSGMAEIYAFEWDYDLVGNRTYENNGVNETYYIYDASNALTLLSRDGVYSELLYDRRGNCRKIEEPDGTIYFEYNHANLVTRITHKNGIDNYFHYDAMLRRYAMQDSDGLRYFTWDRNGVNLLAERDQSGTVTAEYKHGYVPIQGIGSMVYAKKKVGWLYHDQYPVYDHRGTVYRLTDENGNETATYEYNAWGEPIEDENPTAGNRFHYQSNWINLKDSGGEMLISPSRVYHDGVGRFLQHDPLGYVDSMNLYSVFFNDPLSYIDVRGYAGGGIRIPSAQDIRLVRIICLGNKIIGYWGLLGENFTFANLKSKAVSDLRVPFGGTPEEQAREEKTINEVVIPALKHLEKISPKGENISVVEGLTNGIGAYGVNIRIPGIITIGHVMVDKQRLFGDPQYALGTLTHERQHDRIARGAGHTDNDLLSLGLDRAWDEVIENGVRTLVNILKRLSPSEKDKLCCEEPNIDKPITNQWEEMLCVCNVHMDNLPMAAIEKSIRKNLFKAIFGKDQGEKKQK